MWQVLFLQSDSSAEAMEGVPELLKHAEAVGVDLDFIDKVQCTAVRQADGQMARQTDLWIVREAERERERPQ